MIKWLLKKYQLQVIEEYHIGRTSGHGRQGQCVDILRDLPEVVACDRITGEDCFIARAHVRSVAELERLIDKVIPYAMTNTSIIQSSPAANRLPPNFFIGGVVE